MRAVLERLGLESALGDIPELALAVHRYRHRDREEASDSAVQPVSRTSALYAAATRDKRVGRCLARAGLRWDAFVEAIGAQGFQPGDLPPAQDFEINPELTAALERYAREFGETRRRLDGLGLAWGISASREGRWSEAVQKANGDVARSRESLGRLLAGATSASGDTSIQPSHVADQASGRDSLGFEPYVRALAEFLSHPETRGPFTVSVEGEWGSGKTSFMLQLETALGEIARRRERRGAWPLSRAVRRPKRPLTLWFNAWVHDKDEALWAAFALEFVRRVSRQRGLRRRWWGHLRLATRRFEWRRGWVHLVRAVTLWALFAGVLVAVPVLGYSRGGEWLEWLQALQGLEQALAAVVGLGGAAGLVALALSAWIKLKDLVGSPLDVDLKKWLRSPGYAERVSFVEQFHKDFAKIVEAYAGRETVFVFVDDLDRCEVPRAADLMQALNLLMSRDPRLIFIAGMDRQKVAAGLAVKYEKLLPYLGPGIEFGYAFIEKFVQIPFLLPRPAPKDVERFLDTLSQPSPGVEAHPGWHRRLGAWGGSWGPPKDRHGEARDQTADRAPEGVGGLAEPAATPQAGTGGGPTPQPTRREGIKLSVRGDSPALREIVRTVAPALDNNPRRLKQFVNLFRLRAFIAAETGLFDEPEAASLEPLTVEQLGKFVALGLRWPLLLADVENDHRLLGALQTTALDGDDAAPRSPLAERWRGRGDLVAFLRAGCVDEQGRPDVFREQTWSLADVDVAKLLRVSPRVRTIDVTPAIETPPPATVTRPTAPGATRPAVAPAPAGDFVVVPAGEFMMGSDDGGDDERPAHKVFVPEFRIAVHPVTNAQYAEFVQAAGQKPPERWTDGVVPRGLDDHLVTDVNWDDAVAYCRWKSDRTGLPHRLPSEAEWEKAARGTDGRTWPWGNEFDARKCNTSEGGARGTTPVARYPEGRSPYGCYDMAGNVWEWTGSLYQPYPYRADDGREDPDSRERRGLRGGAWSLGAVLARSAYRLVGTPGNAGSLVGFRCVVVPHASPPE